MEAKPSVLVGNDFPSEVARGVRLATRIGPRTIRLVMADDAEAIATVDHGGAVWLTWLDAPSGRPIHVGPVRRSDVAASDLRRASGEGRPLAEEGTVVSPMTGIARKVHVAVGAVVQAGDALVVLEAMKMETTLVAPRAGTVVALFVSEGAPVERGATLLRVS